jgi:polyisoprenoid-binding protein YceI
VTPLRPLLVAAALQVAVPVTLLFAAPASAGESAELRVDPEGSLVYALVYKRGVASAFAHDHVVQAREISGTALLDPDDPARSRAEVTVSVTGLFPDADDLRGQVGLPNTLSDRQRDTILGHIRSEAQLWVEKHDRIVFSATAFDGALGDVQVAGEFTLRGVTRTTTVPLTLAREGDGYRATGTFRILQSDYGYRPYSGVLGTVRTKDEVDIVLDVRLIPAS